MPFYAGEMLEARLQRRPRLSLTAGLDIALKLEDIALSDDYFISRKLYPNVDFY